MKVLLNDKLGITFESVKSGAHSDFGRYDRPLTDTEMNYIQNLVNQVYDDFTGVVERGRGLDSSFVESISQGRVWAASQALGHGLIDGFAGVNECVEIAAAKAKLQNYSLEIYPKQEKFLSRFFSNIESSKREEMMAKEFGVSYTYLKQIQKAMSLSGIQMRLPFTYTID
jgi:protease-4